MDLAGDRGRAPGQVRVFSAQRARSLALGGTAFLPGCARSLGLLRERHAAAIPDRPDRVQPDELEYPPGGAVPVRREQPEPAGALDDGTPSRRGGRRQAQPDAGADGRRARRGPVVVLRSAGRPGVPGLPLPRLAGGGVASHPGRRRGATMVLFPTPLRAGEREAEGDRRAPRQARGGARGLPAWRPERCRGAGAAPVAFRREHPDARGAEHGRGAGPDLVAAPLRRGDRSAAGPGGYRAARRIRACSLGEARRGRFERGGCGDGGRRLARGARAPGRVRARPERDQRARADDPARARRAGPGPDDVGGRPQRLPRPDE